MEYIVSLPTTIYKKKSPYDFSSLQVRSEKVLWEFHFDHLRKGF